MRGAHSPGASPELTRQWAGTVSPGSPAVPAEAGAPAAPAASNGPVAPVETASPEAAHATSRRRDIEGLRAIAIAAVVIYHARPSLLTGGYVGVDVFFVVSGFLITGILVADLEANGRISARRFYAARARRLLPSAALVISATMVASALLLSQLRIVSVAKDAVASAFFVANYRFAFEATNYLSASGPPSPFQHFWSLGVEEQFYLLWPLLLVAGSLVWARPDRRVSRLGLAVCMSVVALASLALCWHLTASDQPWAFYSLPTRAFELAAGGLVALGARRLERLGALPAAALGWVGLALIVAAATRFGATTEFPGAAALAPVLGTAGVIACGCARRRGGPGVLLELPPMQGLGAISYTLYLWHWPVLVLAPSLIGHPLDDTETVVACVFAFGLAVLTTLLLERPVRRSPGLSLRPALSLLSGASLATAAAAVAVLTASAVPALTGHGLVRVAELSSSNGGGHSVTLSGPAGERAALSTNAALINAQVQATVQSSAHAADVPSNLDPPLDQAPGDEPPPMYDGCFDSFVDTEVNPCEYGDTSSTHSIVLFGDSHAIMWFPAIDAFAEAHHDQLIALGKATCPPLDLEVFSPDLDEWYTACDEWRDAAVARIEAMHPALVVLGFSREYGIKNDDVDVYGQAWMTGLSEMIKTLRATGAEVVVIGPVPYPPFIVPACLGAHLTNAYVCSEPNRAPWYNTAGVNAERAVVEAAGGAYIDVDQWFCTASTCPTLIGNMVAYRDDNHVSATYAAWLTPAMSAELALATDGKF